MIEPRVSIIIPIYNTEKYLRDCLLSIQRQTMPHFEALLVNDCTPDGSMQVAEEFVQADSRFRILEHEVNQGPGCARNTGLKTARGEYLNFLDSDDMLPADAIEVLLDLVDTTGADMAIGNMAWLSNHRISPVKYIDTRIRTWVPFWEANLRELPEEVYLPGSMCHRLIKKRVMLDNAVEFPGHVLHEDVPVTMEAWFHSARIVATPHFVYFRTRRDDPGNLSRTQTYSEKAFLDRDIISQRVFEFARQHSGPANNAARLGSVTLLRMLSTTKIMLDSVDESSRRKITFGWFPLHTLRVNNMVNELNALSVKSVFPE